VNRWGLSDHRFGNGSRRMGGLCSPPISSSAAVVPAGMDGAQWPWRAVGNHLPVVWTWQGLAGVGGICQSWHGLAGVGGMGLDHYPVQSSSRQDAGTQCQDSKLLANTEACHPWHWIPASCRNDGMGGVMIKAAGCAALYRPGYGLRAFSAARSCAASRSPRRSAR
jgi:hypothetical protein